MFSECLVSFACVGAYKHQDMWFLPRCWWLRSTNSSVDHRITLDSGRSWWFSLVLVLVLVAAADWWSEAQVGELTAAALFLPLMLLPQPFCHVWLWLWVSLNFTSCSCGVHILPAATHPQPLHPADELTLHVNSSFFDFNACQHPDLWAPSDCPACCSLFFVFFCLRFISAAETSKNISGCLSRDGLCSDYRWHELVFWTYSCFISASTSIRGSF